jgi:hypothetical protein
MLFPWIFSNNGFTWQNQDAEENSIDGTDSDEDEISHSTIAKRIGYDLLCYKDGQLSAISIEYYKRRLIERLATENLSVTSSSVTGSNSIGVFENRMKDLVQITSDQDAETIANKTKLDIASVNGSSRGTSYTQAIREWAHLEAAIQRKHPMTVAGVALRKMREDLVLNDGTYFFLVLSRL